MASPSDVRCWASDITHTAKAYPDKTGVTPNITPAEIELGFRPKVSLTEGLVQHAG
tara:strand:- start:32 stop:199 length:168 start_codon:yes stop_codon:yes gene_type:complete